MENKIIFHDPKGSRNKIVKRVGSATLFVATVVLSVFIFSLFAIPLLPSIPGLTAGFHKKSSIPVLPIPDKDNRLNRFSLRSAKLSLLDEIKNAEKAVRRGKAAFGNKIVAAYYAPWEETGLNSFRANADNLTHLMPAWLKLMPDGVSIDSSDYDPVITPHNLDVIDIAKKNNVKIIPVLSNALDETFDQVRLHTLLSDAGKQQILTGNLILWLKRNNFSGINLDFENINAKDYESYLSFVKTTKAQFDKAGLLLTIAVEVNWENFPYKELSADCSFLVLMLYDEHDMIGGPGPIASFDWFSKTLSTLLTEIPREKAVVGIGNYCYDWKGKTRSAESISYQSALQLAKDYTTESNPEQNIVFDQEQLNATFTYYDDENAPHTVWMLDAVSAYDQYLYSVRSGVAGCALWSFGTEDPDIWKFFDKAVNFNSFNPMDLQKIEFPYEVEFTGDGELLEVVSSPQPGWRTISLSKETGLCVNQSYTEFPSSYLIRRTGFQPKTIVLTFDDGPSSDYTPAILDVLKENNVKATFFVIGENAEREPSLIKRMYAEGHEIGNHTYSHPNLGSISEKNAVLELNATQRVIESILNRSTNLFRPPYNADAEPVSAEEVKPVALASSLGYITVGELLDPQDWNSANIGIDGTITPRTTDDIVKSVLDQIDNVKGNVLLLHDGGGDRSKTIEALNIVIPLLKARGYKFITVSQLAGTTRDQMMPLLTGNDRLLENVDKPVFEFVYVVERGLAFAFIAAIFLGIFRVLFITCLALIKRLKKKTPPHDPSFNPFVTVIIAAYNEEKVINSTIRSILSGAYRNLEIIVVDDGSVDNTAGVVADEFGNNPLVRLFRKENGGKSTALNHAIESARGDIYVNIDADTQLAPDAIQLLVAHFADPEIGAVAGNVKVGNRVNIFTKWQAIEYINSQNIEREAYSLLNAITVVPGAIGAWRASAVKQAGGYVSDTLAEDMDLTWRIRENGWKLDTDNNAKAYTEAPDTLRTFFKQRFRWTYGTLQVLWKHRASTFHYGWFGWLALPTMWIFQILFQVIAPLVDLQILYSLYQFFRSLFLQGFLTKDWQPLPQSFTVLEQVAFYYVLLFGIELSCAIVAFRFDREKYRLLFWFFLQRFVYRQVMYGVLWKSLTKALLGTQQVWGKLQRKANVNIGS